MDYAQALKSEHQTRCEFRWMQQITKELKQMAHTMNMAILLLWQVDWQPTSHHTLTEGNLRAIENGADKALLLHRDGNRASLGLVRPTDTAPTTMMLSWHGDYTRFVEAYRKARIL